MSNTTPASHIHHLLILDESGSMSSIRSTTINAFNELMSHNKNLVEDNPDQEHRLSFFTFNGRGIRTVCFDTPMNESITISEETYKPNDNTPLFDAMGSSILKVKHLVYGKENHSVLVTILTDGEENSSREFTGKEINSMLTELKKSNWAFTYIGTDHDVDAMADTIGIHAGSRINYNKKDILGQVNLLHESRRVWSDRVRHNNLVDNDLLAETQERLKHKDR